MNSNKVNVVINGTYNNVKYTYIIFLSETEDVIVASTSNKKILLKNMNIITSHAYRVVYVPSISNYADVVVEYNNVSFSGIELSCNNYGLTRIIDSLVSVSETNGVVAQRVCDVNRIIISRNTTIISSAITSTVFLVNNVISSFLRIIPNSRVNITTNKELMNCTNKFDFIVRHGVKFLLTTTNGFAITTTHGARNFFITNTYMNTPSDNYNIYFSGTNQKFILDNPKCVNIYTKNANVIYASNPVHFLFKIARINMWVDALDYVDACGLDDMPNFSCYKKEFPMEIEGTFTGDATTVTSHNFTFQQRKVLTIG